MSDGYVFVFGKCYACGRPFTFNPIRVPSVRDEKGVKQPLCRSCVEYINKEREKKGLPRFTIPSDAYEPVSEAELPSDTMFFNVPEARQQLINKGFVYTLRPKMRRTGKDTAFYGSYYKKEKIGDILVDFIKEVKDIEELKEYVSGSGFARVEDWWKAAEGSRFLFKVIKEPSEKALTEGVKSCTDVPC